MELAAGGVGPAVVGLGSCMAVLALCLPGKNGMAVTSAWGWVEVVS